MAFEEYVTTNGQRLRRGYTTGTCASLAAKAAATLLLSGTAPQRVSVQTPAGIPVSVQPTSVTLCKEAAASAPAGTPATQDAATSTTSVTSAQSAHAGTPVTHSTATSARACVVKDAGDDYDVTNGAHVWATVTLCESGISIDGGTGVGRITCPGLDQPVGNAAINSGPRAMMCAALENIAEEEGYFGGFHVVIEVPEGVELGRKTFNPSLGITGGISILGTSGIVEPRSLQALQDALKVEIHVRAANGNKRLVVVPGNYGQSFLETLGLCSTIPVVSCANFIGFTLDQAQAEGFEQVLLVGHIGKLIKVAGGIMDTHSRMADCRRELFAAHAGAAGAHTQTILDIFACATTDACLDVIESAGIKTPVLERISRAIQYHLEHRTQGKFEVGAVVFSNKAGLLTCTKSAQHLLEEWKQ